MNSLKRKRSEEIIDPEATEPIKSDDIEDEPKTSESVQLERESESEAESESESGKKQKKVKAKVIIALNAVTKILINN
ncbi:hypothetical protein F8M41_008714 [Gigaspora margarita]|uniref:Uncharacterized protein n=1 Tax=Gigaspora margarita TaxID=4874 RepID=A0A8H4AVG5_GIGMA|nr:hypothetical protein F8M41_008714 [Gigaspora margarita]